MLYLVSTPIGNLKDISVRAIEILKKVELILAEDTRRAGILLARYGVKTATLSFHEHNKHARVKRIIPLLEKQKDIALISNAGTPAISDPGYTLIKACREHALAYTAVPGATAVINGLLLSGCGPDRFYFAGFLPQKKSKRASLLRELVRLKATLVFFESPHRIGKTCRELSRFFKEKPAALVREMTKIHEETISGTVAELAAATEKRAPRGEIVVVIDNH
jgi:16S rRNA (cytidine1402-2'-O)-methyltransferase